MLTSTPWSSVILQVAINHKVFNDTDLSWLNSAGNNLQWQELSVVLLPDIEQSISILLGVSNTDSNFFEKTYPNNSFPAWTRGKRSRQWIPSPWHSIETLHSDLKSTFLLDSKQSVQCIEFEICIWYPFVYETTRQPGGTHTLFSISSSRISCLHSSTTQSLYSASLILSVRKENSPCQFRDSFHGLIKPEIRLYFG